MVLLGNTSGHVLSRLQPIGLTLDSFHRNMSISADSGLQDPLTKYKRDSTLFKGNLTFPFHDSIFISLEIMKLIYLFFYFDRCRYFLYYFV